MDSSTDDMLRRLASSVEALRSDNDCLKRETRGLQQVTGRLKQKVEGLTRDNAILREEIASLKYDELTAEKSRKRPKTEHLALTTLGNDATVKIVSFLDAKGIACLGRTCGHFGKGFVGAGGQMTSLAEELAGQVVDYSATDVEKDALVGGRKIEILHELEQMRLPLYFEQLIGNISLIKHQRQRGKKDLSTISVSCFHDHAAAISNHVMRTGKHYGTFHVSASEGRFHSILSFGIVRPVRGNFLSGLDWGDLIECMNMDHTQYRQHLLAEKTEEWGNDLHCCCFNSDEGRCFCADWSDEDKKADDDWEGDEWEGMQPLNCIGNFTVGLLLDLNSGTLSVFKDGRKLGVMKEGLTGAYCWYVCGYGITCKVKIEREMPPMPIKG